MIDTLIKITEACIGLIKQRESDDSRFFESVISPLFLSFSGVVKQYFSLLEHSSRTADLNKIRDGYIQARIQVTAAAEVYKSNARDAEVVAFFDSIQDFFYGGLTGLTTVHSKSPTLGYMFVDVLSGARLVSPSHSEIDYENFRDAARSDLQNRWAKAVAAYEKVKVKFTLPIGFKR